MALGTELSSWRCAPTASTASSDVASGAVSRRAWTVTIGTFPRLSNC